MDENWIVIMCFVKYVSTGMPLDFSKNNWKSMCACRLTENEHKKRQKVQKEKDEIGEKKRRKKRKITENRHPCINIERSYFLSSGIPTGSGPRLTECHWVQAHSNTAEFGRPIHPGLLEAGEQSPW